LIYKINFALTLRIARVLTFTDILYYVLMITSGGKRRPLYIMQYKYSHGEGLGLIVTLNICLWWWKLWVKKRPKCLFSL